LTGQSVLVVAADRIVLCEQERATRIHYQRVPDAAQEDHRKCAVVIWPRGVHFFWGQLYSADPDFRITAISRVTAGHVEIEWTSVRERWHRLERATDLGAGDFSVVSPNLEANLQRNAHTDILDGGRRFFFRIGETAPPIAYAEPVIQILGYPKRPSTARRDSRERRRSLRSAGTSPAGSGGLTGCCSKN
jgi:hypothetical protein